MNTDLDSPTIAVPAVTPTSPEVGPVPPSLADALASSPGLEPPAPAGAQGGPGGLP